VDHRHRDDSAEPDSLICFAHRRCQVLGLDVGNVDDGGIDQRTGRDRRLPAWDLGEESRGLVSGALAGIVLRGEMQQLAVVAGDDGVLAAAQPTGASHDGIEDWLHVGR
jgi:hypothetical protein